MDMHHPNYCERMKKMGQCKGINANPDMRTLCEKTCGFCDGKNL